MAAEPRAGCQAGHGSSKGRGWTHVPGSEPAVPEPCPRSHLFNTYLLELGKEGVGLLLQHSPVPVGIH